MQIVLYADLHKKTLSDSTSGGSNYSFPKITQGDKVQIGIRFLDNVDGSTAEVTKTVGSIRASIGAYDARPESGYFVLRVGDSPYVEGENQTPPIAFNATARAVQTALAEIGFGGATVLNTNGSWIISNDGQRVESLKGTSVSGLVEALRPLSFVRVREMQFNGGYHYDVRLIQSPLASTVDFVPVLPAMPEVKRIQEGGNDAFAEWPEIQSLKILPTFTGTYIIKRGYKRTMELSAQDGPIELEAALATLADEGGFFKVTNPRNNVAHITFLGSMNGFGHDLLEVVVTTADAGDPTITLNTNTLEVAEALRAAPEVASFLEIEATFRNEDDTLTTMSLCKTPITIERELNWAGLEVASNIDWLRPPIGETYVPFTRNQVIFGSQHYAITISPDDYDSSSGAHLISHNLGTTDLHVSVFDQTLSGKLVEPLEVMHQSDDVLSVKFASVANVGQYRLVISTAGPKSAFQSHTHTIEQIDGLSFLLNDLGERVEILERFIPTSNIGAADGNQGVAGWTLPTFFEVFPMRTQPSTDGSTAKQNVKNIDAKKLPRGGGLLPAKYLTGSVTVANTLPTSPSLTAVYSYTDTADTLYLPGYLGRKGRQIKAPFFYGWDGRGFYQVEQVNTSESVYYPTDFSRELFRVHVNDRQLRSGKQFKLEFGVVAAVFKSNTPVHWGVVVDIGIPTKNPSNPSNVSDIQWLPPSLDYSFILTEVASTHTFGIKIARTLVNLADSYVVEKILYGASETTSTVLTSTNFVVRGRLARFDTGNNELDPRGLVAVDGLKVEVEGSPGAGQQSTEYGIANVIPYSAG